MSDNTAILEELRQIEERVNAGESQSIVARWEFGRALLAQRIGKQLPNGLRRLIADKFNLGYTEISQRMRFADKYATEDKVVACANTYGTWNRIKRDDLPEQRKERAAQDSNAGLGIDEPARGEDDDTIAGLIREVDEVCRRAALYGSRISVLTDEHRDVVIVTDRDIASVDQDDDEPSVYKFTDSDGETIVGMIVEGGTVERHLDGTYIVQL